MGAGLSIVAQGCGRLESPIWEEGDRLRSSLICRVVVVARATSNAYILPSRISAGNIFGNDLTVTHQKGNIDKNKSLVGKHIKMPRVFVLY